MGWEDFKNTKFFNFFKDKDEADGAAR